jgi:hypothetical protein
MLLAFRDFAPQMTDPPGLFKPARFTSLQHALNEANSWINLNGIDVVNVETVVLPNTWSPHEQGTSDPELHQSGDMPTAWNQFIRVWYHSKG